MKGSKKSLVVAFVVLLLAGCGGFTSATSKSVCQHYPIQEVPNFAGVYKMAPGTADGSYAFRHVKGGHYEWYDSTGKEDEAIPFTTCKVGKYYIAEFNLNKLDSLNDDSTITDGTSFTQALLTQKSADEFHLYHGKVTQKEAEENGLGKATVTLRDEKKKEEKSKDVIDNSSKEATAKLVALMKKEAEKSGEPIIMRKIKDANGAKKGE